MGNLVTLSSLAIKKDLKNYTAERLVDELLEMKYVGIINDLGEKPYIEYELCDLIVVTGNKTIWDKIKLCLS